MKKYYDIFGITGIAAIFATNFAADFANFFADVAAATVDAYITHKYGDRPLSNKIAEDNAAATVCGIIAVNLRAWQKIHAALTAEYDAAQTANETKTKSGTIERENLNTNSEKAFNDAEFTADTQNSADGTETYDLTETRTETGGAAVQNISREIDLRKRQNLQYLIIDTIINEICLTIY